MSKCGENIATKLTTDTVIGEDCQGNPVHAGNAIATCADLNNLVDNVVNGFRLNGEFVQVETTEGDAYQISRTDFVAWLNINTDIDTDQVTDFYIGGVPLNNSDVMQPALIIRNEDGTEVNITIDQLRTALGIDTDQVQTFTIEFVEEYDGNGLIITNEDGSTASISLHELFGYVSVSTQRPIVGDGTSDNPIRLALNVESPITGNGSSSNPLTASIQSDESLTGDGSTSEPLSVKLSDVSGNLISMYSDGIYYGIEAEQSSFYFSPAGSSSGDGTQANPYRNPEDAISEMDSNKSYKWHFETGGSYEWKSSNRKTLEKLEIIPYGSDWSSALSSSNNAGSLMLAMSNASYVKPIINLVSDATSNVGGVVYATPALFYPYSSSSVISITGVNLNGDDAVLPLNPGYPAFFGQGGKSKSTLIMHGCDVTLNNIGLSSGIKSFSYKHGLVSTESAYLHTINNSQLYTIDYGLWDMTTSDNITGGVYQFYQPVSDLTALKNLTSGITGQVVGNVASAQALYP